MWSGVEEVQAEKGRERGKGMGREGTERVKE
jgi:hypothetical protein